METKCTYTDGKVNYYFTFENGLYYYLYNQNDEFIAMTKTLEPKSSLIKKYPNIPDK